ncbi:MAG: hypothetical protein CM15mP106_0090 [Candidatus Neomarinimicrobiota bacterium]|nr:MAG: hypothetical protein CM15mP106_0090 [Candidatus Neomarinimicrobiota bacterium]
MGVEEGLNLRPHRPFPRRGKSPSYRPQSSAQTKKMNHSILVWIWGKGVKGWSDLYLLFQAAKRSKILKIKLVEHP